MKISVIIPTVRPDGLEHAAASLSKQTFTDFEVLVGSPFPPSIGRWVKDDFTGGFWSLNRIYNRLFDEAKGELLVSLQDFVWVPPNGLERFWWVYENTKGLVGGVGHTYDRVELDGAHGPPCWKDPHKLIHESLLKRADELGDNDDVRRNVVRLNVPKFMEWNWGAFPREAILSVGGMDDELDFIGFSCDNLSAVERMFAKGHPFFLDFANEILAQKHGRPENWKKFHLVSRDNFNLYNLRQGELLQSESWPVLKRPLAVSQYRRI